MISLMLYAIVQIIVEMVPVSSSGHVMLLQYFFEWCGHAALPIEEWYDHFLHGPTLIILMIYFSNEWLKILQPLWHGCMQRTASWWRLISLVGKIVLYIGLADCATALMYLTFKKWLDVSGIALNHSAVMVGMCVTMALLLSTIGLKKRPKHALTWKHALLLGFVQGCAFFPGLSRFGSTYVVARWLGLSHRRAFQFSFAMFVPFIVVAFLWNGIPGMMHHSDVVASVLLPCLCATVCAYFIFGLVERMAVRGYWYYLGWYMLLPLSLMCWMVLR